MVSAAMAGEDEDEEDRDFKSNKFRKVQGEMQNIHGQRAAVMPVGGGERLQWGAQDDFPDGPDDGPDDPPANMVDQLHNALVAVGNGAAAAAAAAGAGAAAAGKAPAKGKGAGAGVKKRKWTEDELAAFKEALKVHGVGHWQKMKDDPRFSDRLAGRTGVNLKDKWRNMEEPMDE